MLDDKEKKIISISDTVLLSSLDIQTVRSSAVEPKFQKHPDNNCVILINALDDVMYNSTYAEEACDIWSLICWLNKQSNLESIAKLDIQKICFLISVLEEFRFNSDADDHPIISVLMQKIKNIYMVREIEIGSSNQ
jgi:hypothetical protein